MISAISKYQLQKKGLLLKEDDLYLKDFYLPLIGYKTCFLYKYFCLEIEDKEIEGNIGKILNETTLSLQDFIVSKKILESIGLVNTFLDEDNDAYIFILSSILSPSEFLNSPVHKGLLFSILSKEQQDKLILKYTIKNETKGYKEVTASVKDSFSFAFDSSFALNTNLGDILKKNINLLNDNFDDKDFFTYLKKNSNINPNAFSQDELKKLHDLASLYDVDSKDLAFAVIESFNYSNEVGSKIDFEYLKNRIKMEISVSRPFKPKENKKIVINSETELANKINKFENTSPRIFLKEVQKGVEPIRSDLNLIDFLNEHFGFGNGVINVILDYCLKVNDGSLPRQYVEKIASNLYRKNVNNSLDAYNCLHQFNKKKSDVGKNKEAIVENENKPKATLTKEELADIDALFED